MNGLVSLVLKEVSLGKTLDAGTAEAFMNQLMDGHVTSVQTAGVLAAMAVRGETVDEIVGFARAMQRHARPMNVPGQVIDTCGTGGDGADTFNISTASAIVCAAAGVPVAKHGNRAVSSKSGSADVLQALGLNIELDVPAAEQCLRETNLCFLFAPSYHPAMKYAAVPRKELGFRTIFNILGPLTNPAKAKRQILGVFRENLVSTVAQALVQLGSEHVLVVHGEGNIDELSLQGPSQVAEVKNGQVKTYTVSPDAYGLSHAPLSAIQGGDSFYNAELIRSVFHGQKGPTRDVVVLNAGAALYVAGRAKNMSEGVRLAEDLIDVGAATQKLEQLVSVTKRLAASTEVSHV